MPELRQNIITRDWVVVAPERAKRPKDFIVPKSIKVSQKDTCPFCVGSDGFRANKDLIQTENERIYVVENRFPAFIPDETKKSIRSFYPEEGFYRAKASIGDHEVVIIKEHDLNIFEFGKPLLNELLETIRERYICISDKENVVSILPIYNHGAEAGASLDHPHAQIFASGIVGNTVGREMIGADEYYGNNGTCVYCDMIKHEKKEKIRIVYENEMFVAIAFYAPRFPFETWIMPKDHESQFEKTTKTSMEFFAEAVDKVLKMLGQTIDNPSLNWYIHTLPTIYENSSSYHWHLEIAPRISRYGGFELGSEVIINTMPPEEAAAYLKGKEGD